ncbi:MAG: hypothetical protein ACE5JG_00255 [Planctomycetota bacterium]
MGRILVAAALLALGAGAFVLVTGVLKDPGRTQRRPDETPEPERDEADARLAALDSPQGGPAELQAFLDLGGAARRAVLRRLRSRPLPHSLIPRAGDLGLDPAPVIDIAADPTVPPPARRSAYRVLARMDGETVFNQIRLAVLREEDPYVVLGALEGVELQADPAYCGALLQRFRKERGTDLEAALLTALGVARCSDALPAVRKRLRDETASFHLLQVGLQTAMRLDREAGRALGREVLGSRTDLSTAQRASISALLE